jgi:hypothetical protein
MLGSMDFLRESWQLRMGEAMKLDGGATGLRHLAPKTGRFQTRTAFNFNQSGSGAAVTLWWHAITYLYHHR